MDLLQTILYSIVLSLADILPVSAKAHSMLISALGGGAAEPVLLRLMIHIGTLAALYINCQNHILRIIRARRLSRIAKRNRTRPLDTNSLMDLRILQTMLIPVIFAFINYQKLHSLVGILSILAGIILVNGVILYIPQFLPGSNKTSLSISPFDGILMGIAAGLSLIPGLSCMGLVLSVALMRGVEKSYAVNLALLLNIGMTAGYIVLDFLGIAQNGLGIVSFITILYGLVGAAAAFGGTYLGMYILKKLAAGRGFSLFAYYCWGAAMFIFILFLSV